MMNAMRIGMNINRRICLFRLLKGIVIAFYLHSIRCLWWIYVQVGCEQVTRNEINMFESLLILYIVIIFCFIPGLEFICWLKVICLGM